MLSRLPKVNQILGHWLGRTDAAAPSTPETGESEATDGDLPHGAGFREAPPDPNWRLQDDAEDVEADPQRASPQEEPSARSHDRDDSREWSALRSTLRERPVQSRIEGLARYRSASGRRLRARRFRKGIVFDQAA